MKILKTILPPRIAPWAAVALTFMLACSAASDLFNPNKKPEIKSPEIQSLVLDKDELDPGETVTATVSATDANGQTLSYDWGVSGGQLLPPLDRSQVKWKTPAVGGVYRITVTVSNEEKSAYRSVSATVRSPVGPVVKILSPSEGSHWMQHTTLSVTAEARHDNGIARVDLFLNGSSRPRRTAGRMRSMTSRARWKSPPGRPKCVLRPWPTSRGGREAIRWAS